ncbi:hypothetical protein B0H14DRAFT_3143710 [Mycena olivaceomarginata]|nr:hypothetical protein B0H14DRAFT_3143710 [Mycena olivaceomarginata]
MALMRDPRFREARYRRAIARWKQGRLMDPLVDLERADAGAVVFAKISAEHEILEWLRDSLHPMSILQADYPSAYGSPAAAPRPAQSASVSVIFVVPDTGLRIPKDLRAGTCASCKTVKWTRASRVKTCRGVGNCFSALAFLNFASAPPPCIARSSIGWADTDALAQITTRQARAQKDCTRYRDDQVFAMYLCKYLLDHKCLRMNFMFYAMRSMGALHHATPPYLTIILVFVKMVPLVTGTGLPARQRISITNIVTAPLCVLDDDMRDTYKIQLEQMRRTCEMPALPGIAVVVTPVLKEDNDKSRTSILMHRLVPELVVLAT